EEDHTKLKKKVRKINVKIAKQRRRKGSAPRFPKHDNPKIKISSKAFCDADFSSSEVDDA
ncbi:unnamed protein product, partial [Candidula unifasciata]